MGFGRGGYSRAHGQNKLRILAVIGFMVMSALAIGVPLLSRPAVVVVAPVADPVVPTPVPMVNVYMPVQRIAPGTQVSPVMFRVEGMSPVSVAALGGQIVKSEAEIVGRYARALIMPGRPIMSAQLMDAPENTITRKIRPGFRAITIQVNNVTGIEGWGAPGARVDVLWESDGEGGDVIVTTVVKNAQILSVAGKAENPAAANLGALANMPKGLPLPPPPGNGAGEPKHEGDKAFTVTLLVTPEEGQRVFLATRAGTLSLMLRGDFDVNGDGNTQASVTTKRVMQGGDRKAPERVEGVVKARRSDGSFEEWSVIEGRVWRWDQGQSSTTWAQ
jgi:pilus assembly protein CpaB